MDNSAVPACSCPVAGWCERHKTQKNAKAHEVCQTNPVFRAEWDRRASVVVAYKAEKAAAPPAEPKAKGCATTPCGKSLRQRLKNVWNLGWNFAAATKEWAGKGFRTTTEEQYEERRAICSACPSGLLTSSGQCGQGPPFDEGCGCIVALKAAIVAPGKGDCPKGHWPKLWPVPVEPAKPQPRVIRPTKPTTPAKIDIESPDAPRLILMSIRKGLGDTMSFRTVLRHIHALRPAWTVDVLCHPYHRSAFEGLCRQVTHVEPKRGDSAYQTYWTPNFMRPKRCYTGHPSNTTQMFLRDFCRLTPQAALCGYGTLAPTGEELEAARRFVEPLGERIIVWHSKGRSFPNAKNPTPEEWEPFVQRALDLGYSLVALDFDKNNELALKHSLPRVDADTPGFGESCQHATALAALLSMASLYVGVDSGPLHVAGACEVPAIGVWMKHHPAHSYNLAENVLHLVPADHARYLPITDRDAGLEVFKEHYRHATYTNLAKGLVERLEEIQ